MPNVDTPPQPGSGDHEDSTERSAGIDTNKISLPNKGECFSEVHLRLIRAKIVGWLRSEFQVNSELDLIKGVDDLANRVCLDAIAAGMIHTSATALLWKITQNRLMDSFRSLVARSDSILGSIDDDDFSPIAYSDHHAPTAYEPDHEAALARDTADFIMWGLPEAPPGAAAALAHYLSRAGPEALSLKNVCERLPRSYTRPLRKLYRQWHHCFEFPEANRRHLFDLLTERPELPLTRAHYFYAGDCDHRTVGTLVQKALVISRCSSSELRDFVGRIQHQAMVRSRFTAEDWRNTESVYFANRDIARREALLLSEHF